MLKLCLLGLMVVPFALIRPPSAAPVAAAVIVEAAAVEEAMAAEAVAVEVTTAVAEAMVSDTSWLVTNLANRIRWRLRQPRRRR